MDIDPMGPDIDAVDQGGQEGTLSCSAQLGPTLADFPGARDEP
jgi:hypothetical protein